MYLLHTICKTRTSGAAAAQATPLMQVQPHSLGEEKQAGVLSICCEFELLRSEP